MIKHSEEFKREAVRIALTSGLPRIWGLAIPRWASGCHSIGQPTWYQHLKQIWRVRMNGCA